MCIAPGDVELVPANEACGTAQKVRAKNRATGISWERFISLAIGCQIFLQVVPAG